MGAEAKRRDETVEWLRRAEQKRVLGGSQRRYDLLNYLVGEELGGRGDKLKAYAIALDVLGRGEDFDPSTDSIVRVEIARLRDALEIYYARSKVEREVLISIPKGTYRPSIIHPEMPTQDAPQPPRFSLSKVHLAAISAALVGVIGMCLVWVLAPSPEVRRTQAPIVEIARLGSEGPTDGSFFAVGFRQQLLTDLAHLPTVIVRDGPVNADALRSGAVPSPDYFLKVTPALDGQSGIMGLQLTSASDETIVWAKSIAVSQNSSDFYLSLVEAVQGIGQEIAGPTGAITIDQARHALQSSPQEVIAPGEYDCLVVSLVFDATKDVDARARSRACLKQAVADGTQNPNLLAAHALNLFFDSSDAPDDSESTALLRQAERYARRATAINGSDSFSQEVLGNVLSALGDRLGATAHYTRAVELAPSRPAPHFLLGWQQALRGDWHQGVVKMQTGIDMQPNVPGYMIVPLALDAFRRSDYELSLERAKAIIDRGDPRGYALAFAASVAIGDKGAADAFFFHPDARTSDDPQDPMREVRITFSNPDVMPKYEEIIGPYLSELQSR